jgi:DNA-binding MarR family transcriptional regulator
MTVSGTPDPLHPGQTALGQALRRALIGYLQLIGAQLTAAGFDDRKLPESRVLALCARPGETTISDVGRRLGITRQGASKIVSGLHERGYLTVRPSATDGREKVLGLTPRAEQFLATVQDAGRAIEAKLREEVGADEVDNLFRALDLLARHASPLRGGALSEP